MFASLNVPLPSRLLADFLVNALFGKEKYLLKNLKAVINLGQLKKNDERVSENYCVRRIIYFSLTNDFRGHSLQYLHKTLCYAYAFDSFFRKRFDLVVRFLNCFLINK